MHSIPCKISLIYYVSISFLAVIDDGSLTDDMLYEIINNLTKSGDKSTNDSASPETEGD